MQTINLDLTVKGIVPLLHAKQGDVGRKFQAVITDGGTVYQIPTGAQLSVWYSGASGEGNYSAIGDNSAFVINGNTVTVELITQMLTNSGSGALCLVLNAVDGSQIGMWNIPYVVEKVPGMGSSAAGQYYTALSEVAQQAAASAEKAAQAAAAFNILSAYPVGSIYMSMNSTSPASLFGGTWERILQRFLFAAEDGAGYQAGKTGGSAVTVHDHAVPMGLGGGYLYADSKYGVNNMSVAAGEACAITAGNTNITTTLRSRTDSTYLENMPPYLAVYMWKRTA